MAQRRHTDAPKGPHLLAQGNALGGMQHPIVAPSGQKPFSTRLVILPLQGAISSCDALPRAVPWAVWSWPCRPILCCADSYVIPFMFGSIRIIRYLCRQIVTCANSQIEKR